MKVFITGMAGFIGSRLAEVLADRGIEVIGIDNLNPYYDPSLKMARLRRSGFKIENSGLRFSAGGSSQEAGHANFITSDLFPCLKFMKMDINDEGLPALLSEISPDIIIHLAAQPGVRYSIENPEECLQDNIMTFVRILESARSAGIRRIIYASSSSVYGQQSPHAFRETDAADSPQSVYAVSKRTNEMLAKIYSDMYGMRLTGLRFFSVYGEWGRPDMAPYIFTDALLSGNPISLFNGGQLSRDFTYIDDVAECVRRIVENGNGIFQGAPESEIINIGHGSPTLVSDMLALLEKLTGKKAIKRLLPMQNGEMRSTLADSSKMKIQYGYQPSTPLETGLAKFVKWYVDHEMNRADRPSHRWHSKEIKPGKDYRMNVNNKTVV